MKALFVIKPFVIEPLGIMHLSAAAKKAGHEVDLALTSEDLEQKISEFKPDLVGYSVMTGDQNFYLLLNKNLKKKRKFVSIFGGPHPTFFPEIINEEGVDIVCRGEGEEAVVELANAIEVGKDYSNIANLIVKKGKEIRTNGVRQLANIDSLDFPDRTLVDKILGIKGGPIKHFISSRGCPFNCSYCFNEPYSKIYEGKGKRVRFRSVDNLIEEIKEVVREDGRFVYFQDDTFSLSRDWLKEFSVKYSKQVGLPFHCHVRPNTLDEEKVKLLKIAGCYSVHIAAETADDKLRNLILNRNMTKKQIYTAAEILRAYNIRFMLQNMIGLPEGNLEKDLKTLEMNIKCKPDYAWVSIFQPYPGTKLGEYCRKKGIYTGDFSDLESSFFESSKLNFSNEYKNQLANLQKLFAVLVEYPELHLLGLSKVMINADHAEVADIYKRAYIEFRKKGDERLYGFAL